MKKELIVLRSSKEFKDSLKTKAESLGLTLTSYVRMVLKKSLKNE